MLILPKRSSLQLVFNRVYNFPAVRKATSPTNKDMSNMDQNESKLAETG